MTTPPDWHVHHRALLMLDELHRLGFEQLRFARSREGQYLRLQLYPAQNGEAHDWLLLNDGPLLTFSYQFLSLRLPQMARADPSQMASLERQWPNLLMGAMKPQHLAGKFILDFPELLRPAYGPDHEYRQWFRLLRPHLHQGRLPLTYDEHSTLYGLRWSPDSHSAMTTPDGAHTLLPAPPTNPFIQAQR